MSVGSRVLGLTLTCVLCACSADRLVGPQRDAGDAATFDAGVSGTTDVQVIVEPSDDAKALLDAINNAKSSVHLTMYYLSSSSFIDALIARHQAGVDVKVVLNQTFPSPGFDNAQTFQQLSAAGVPVVWAGVAYNFTHEKCAIIDGVTAWITTMNMTFTSPSQNREYLAVDTDTTDVAEAEAIFQADFDHVQPSLDGDLVVSPNNSRDKLVGLVEAATSTLDVEGETMSDDAFVAALIAAQGRGVAVRVILSDQTPSSAQSQSVSQLEQAGIAVVKLATPYVHAKAMVVDGAQAYVGSANFTANSLDQNRELGLIVAAPAEVAKVASTIDGDFGAGTTY